MFSAGRNSAFEKNRNKRLEDHNGYHWKYRDKLEYSGDKTQDWF